ncbi:MAG: cyanophycinase [Xenococcaceae cyanobacterium MO_188.B29]|nr:cyanophycinase [Xenococcaceae cyanobacterium MO_188.B29]
MFNQKIATAVLSSLVLHTAPVYAGDLVLVGGSWQWPATEDPYGISIYQEIIELAGGADTAKIGIFTTGSSSGQNARRNGQLYVEDFQDLYREYYPDLEADVEWISLHIDNCSSAKNNPNIVNQINTRNTFVFGGGDQSLITECFFNENQETETRTPTPVFEALQNKFAEDAVIAGTSAGTAVQTGIPMITEGESYEALLNEPNSLVGSPPFVSELYYNPLGGFDFFPYGLTDTHFSARGRQGRTIRLAASLDVPTIYGVDENTTLIVRDVGTEQVSMDVLGERGVSIFELSNANINDREDEYWSISNVPMTYLTEGDRYNPLTKIATFPNKSPLVCVPDKTVPQSTDIFSTLNSQGDRTNPREFINIATDLVESCDTTATGRSQEKNPVAFQVKMSENNSTKGYLGLDSQGKEKQSFTNLTIDIQSKKVPEPSLFGILGLSILEILRRGYGRGSGSRGSGGGRGSLNKSPLLRRKTTEPAVTGVPW